MKYCVPSLMLVLLFGSLSTQKGNPPPPTQDAPTQPKPVAQVPRSSEDDIRLLAERLEQLERVAEAQKELREKLEERFWDELKSNTESIRKDVSEQWKKTQNTTAEANKALNELVPPLGAMLPYFGEPAKIPDGYVLADGKTRWPSENWVPRHLVGKPVPDLTGRVLRGIGSVGLLGERKGADEVRTSVNGAHTHMYEIPKETGRMVRDQRAEPEGAGLDYQLKQPSGAWNIGLHLQVAKGGTGVGQHAHYIDGGRKNTSREGDHSHTVPIVPSYIAARFIIRMK